MKMNNSNKQLILDFYTRILGQTDSDFAESVIAENYIQHNPMVKTGRNGFMEFLMMLKQIPKSGDQKKPFKRLICDGDLVVVHSQITFMGKENAVVDLFRIENNKIVEHWDAVQEIVNAKPVVVGTLEFDEEELTETNKQLVREFINQLFIQRQTAKLTGFVANDLTLGHFEMEYDHFKLYRVIGERNFVLTQSEIIVKGVSFAVYDIYRLSSRRIVEHWRVKQRIPGQMAHNNGMF